MRAAVRLILMGTKTPIQRAISYLRSLGQDAHVWLPGIGALNGIQTANYLDSAGTTLAAVDGPVGKVVDSFWAINLTQNTTASKPVLRRGLYSYLTWSNDPSNAAWVKVSSCTVSGTVVSLPAVNDQLRQQVNMSVAASSAWTVGMVLSGTGTVSISMRLAGGSFAFFGVTQITLTSTPTLYVANGVAAEAVAGLNTYLYRNTGDTATAVTLGGAALFQGILTAQQILAQGGIPTTTTAAASNPNAGSYWWQFDGSNDSLQLSSVPFQMSDDHCVIVSGMLNNTGAVQAVQQVSGAGATLRVGAIQLNNLGIATAIWYDGTANNSVSSLVSSYGIKRVWSARKVGGFGVLREDGAARPAVAITATGDSTGGSIGSFIGGTFPSNGNIGPAIAIKATVSDANLLLLENLVGKLSGVPGY